MTQRTGGQDRRVGGMNGRAAAWLAWSLVVVSVVLLVGGLSFALMTRSTVPDGSITLSVLALAFSVVGAIIASRQPRNAIGWIFCSVGVTIGLSSWPQLLRRGLRRVLAGERFRHGCPRRDGGVVLLVVVDASGIRTHELLVAVVPRRPATLAALAARGLVRCARAHRLPRGLHAESGTPRRLPTGCEPLRCRQPYSGGGW